MRDITMLILACKQLLELKTHFTVEYRAKFRGDNKKDAGYCSSVYRKNKLIKFRVVINCTVMIECNWDSYSVIAHELVHAKMIESDTFNDEYHHDEVFQNICHELEKHLRKAGFPLTCPLYSAISDTT